MPLTTSPVDLSVRAAHDLTSTFRLDVDLAFDEPVTALVGPSGSGKSSTLLTIAGLLPGAKASVRLGADVWDDPERGSLVLPEHRGVSYVPQGLALFPHLTARENVAFPLAGPLPEKLERAERLLKRMRIEHVGSRYPAQLSGGEAQRVALARAMARAPKLVLLDEPFSALDRPTRHRLYEVLEDWLSEANVPALIVTHDEAEAARFARSIVAFADGFARYGAR